MASARHGRAGQQGDKKAGGHESMALHVHSVASLLVPTLTALAWRRPADRARPRHSRRLIFFDVRHRRRHGAR
jgi:hypothetical protein